MAVRGEEVLFAEFQLCAKHMTDSINLMLILSQWLSTRNDFAFQEMVGHVWGQFLVTETGLGVLLVSDG